MAQINWLDIVALGKRVESFLVWSWLEEQTLSERQQKLQEVMDLLTDGTLRPPEGAIPPPHFLVVLQTLMKRQQKLQEVMDLLTDGTLRPPEGTVLSLCVIIQMQVL